MFVTSKRNRNVLVISLLMLGILVGYQNCASSGKAAFTAINTGLEGYDYMIGGVSSTRYVGDSDRFDLRAIGIETLPNIVELDLILPSGQIINASQTTADPSNAFSYTYPTPGDYFYNYSFQVEDHTINYGFKVLVKPRLGTCTEPNDVSLHIVGQGNLNPGVTALYNIEADLDCYTNISAIDWNVLVGETDVYSGTDSDLDFIYTFNQANTYTVIAKLSAQRLGQEPIQNITLQKTVVVGTSAGSCDPNLITLTQSGNIIGEEIRLSLNLPSCFNAGQIAHVDWDVNVQDRKDQIDFAATSLMVNKTFNIAQDQLVPNGENYISNVQVFMDVHGANNTITRYIKNYVVRLKSNVDGNTCAYLNSDMNLRTIIQVNPSEHGIAIDFSPRVSPVAASAFTTVYRVYDLDSTRGYVLTGEFEKDGEQTNVNEYEFVHSFTSPGHKKIEVELAYATATGVPQAGCGTIRLAQEFDIVLPALECTDISNSYKIGTPNNFITPIQQPFWHTIYVTAFGHESLNSNFISDKVTAADYSFYTYSSQSHSYEFDKIISLVRSGETNPNSVIYTRPAGIYKVFVATDYGSANMNCSNMSKTEYYRVFDSNVSCQAEGTLYQYNAYCNGTTVVASADPIFECRDADGNTIDISCCKNNPTPQSQNRVCTQNVNNQCNDPAGYTYINNNCMCGQNLPSGYSCRGNTGNTSASMECCSGYERSECTQQACADVL